VRVSEFDEKLNSLLSNPDSMAQIMKLAQSLSGEDGAGTASSDNGAGPSFTGNPGGSSGPPASARSSGGNVGSGGDALSSLLGGLDPGTLMKFLPLVQELGNQDNNNARQLLYALRPYLKPARQEKVERALQLARLVHIGKKFLTVWGDGHV
jgi:hypothetical protein